MPTSRAVAWVVYRLQTASGRNIEIDAARAVLLAVQHAMVGVGDRRGWGGEYFNTSYRHGRARARSMQDYELVENGRYGQVLGVPTAPLETLIASRYAGDMINEQTIYAASIALWHVENFNQLVQQQSQLVATHLPEIADQRTRRRRREALALAFRAQSEMLHDRGVGNAGDADGWYRELCDAVTENIAALDRLQPRSWWRWYRQQGWLIAADVAFAGLLIVLVSLVIGRAA